MNEAKRKRLEAAGWRVGDAEDYIDWLCDGDGDASGHSEIVGDGGGGAAVVAAVGCAAEGGGGS